MKGQSRLRFDFRRAGIQLIQFEKWICWMIAEKRSVWMVDLIFEAMADFLDAIFKRSGPDKKTENLGFMQMISSVIHDVCQPMVVTFAKKAGALTWHLALLGEVDQQTPHIAILDASLRFGVIFDETFRGDERVLVILISHLGTNRAKRASLGNQYQCQCCDKREGFRPYLVSVVAHDHFFELEVLNVFPENLERRFLRRPMTVELTIFVGSSNLGFELDEWMLEVMEE